MDKGCTRQRPGVGETSIEEKKGGLEQKRFIKASQVIT